MKKSISNLVTLVFIIFCVGLILTQVAMAMLGGKDPQTPYAEKAYQAASYNLCLAEQALSNAKLADYFDGFIQITDEDILRLKNKKESECSFQ